MHISSNGFGFVNAMTTLCPIVSFALISASARGLVFGNDTGLPQNSHSVAPAGSGAPQDLHLMIFVPILHIRARLRNVMDKQQYQEFNNRQYEDADQNIIIRYT